MLKPDSVMSVKNNMSSFININNVLEMFYDSSSTAMTTKTHIFFIEITFHDKG